MARSFVDRLIYSITNKPNHCVKLRNPPKTPREKILRPQEARQEQYNEWSRARKVYSGSFLPKDETKLLKKGWEDKKELKSGGKIIQRKSTGQTVRCEEHGNPKHYHWLDFWDKPFTASKHRKFKEKEYRGEDVYYNKYGELTSKRDPAHHLYGDEEND